MVELTQDIDAKAKEAGRLRLHHEKDTRKWTWDQFADEVGLKSSTLSNIANGYDEMTLRVAVIVCTALDIALDDFLDLGHSAKRKPARPVTAGGHVDLQGVKGRQPVRVEIDMPELGLKAGDVLIVDTDEAPQLQKLVVVEDEHKASRIYRVRAMQPMILERSAGPATVFDDRYHRILAAVVRMIRDNP